MTVLEQSALLPYSAEKLFELINDIESYPEFMDGCKAAKILGKQEGLVTATLTLGKGSLKSSFTTRNLLVHPQSMQMELVDGPFKVFNACWAFKALNESACKVSLNMEFEFNSGLLDAALKGVFDKACRNLVNAVCNRAELLYGNK